VAERSHSVDLTRQGEDNFQTCLKVVVYECICLIRLAQDKDCKYNSESPVPQK
jgi:hypothetical protein